ncbi:unnamed protein product, partial [Candida parapsilosis]
MSSDSKAPAQP